MKGKTRDQSKVDKATYSRLKMALIGHRLGWNQHDQLSFLLFSTPSTVRSHDAEHCGRLLCRHLLGHLYQHFC